MSMTLERAAEILMGLTLRDFDIDVGLIVELPKEEAAERLVLCWDKRTDTLSNAEDLNADEQQVTEVWRATFPEERTTAALVCVDKLHGCMDAAVQDTQNVHNIAKWDWLEHGSGDR